MNELEQKINELQGELCKLQRKNDGVLKRASREERQRQAALLAAAGLSVEPRNGSRFWNLLAPGGRLVCVTVYRKGAVSVGLELAAAWATAQPATAAA